MQKIAIEKKIVIGDEKTDRLLCATLKISIIFVQLTI